MAKKAVVSWSSGKDSAYALWEARRSEEQEVVGLLTTVTGAFHRVSIHGVREELLDRQAAAVGLPLVKVEIPYPCPNETYDRAMASALETLWADGIRRIVFGDLFLREVREYRESRLRATGFEAVFPLWQRPTDALAREMIDQGLEARVVSLDLRVLPRAFAGRRFDRTFLRDLPASVDPCGEHGEFHTFASAGPMFSTPVPVSVGPTVERDGFLYTDLTPR